MLGQGVRTQVCTLAVCLHHGAVYTVHLPPCHPFVYCVWYSVMYGDMRYGDMHGVVYNILVFRRPVALLLLACDIPAPGTSLVTFVRCPSRVRGMTCNILVRLPFYPHLFVFRVLRRQRTPYASGLAMHGVSYLRYISTVVRFVTYLFARCLHLTVLCLLPRFLALRGI